MSSSDYEEPLPNQCSDHIDTSNGSLQHNTDGSIIMIPRSLSTSTSFFYWKDLYPELNILVENFEIIKTEAESIRSVLDSC